MASVILAAHTIRLKSRITQTFESQLDALPGGKDLLECITAAFQSFQKATHRAAAKQMLQTIELRSGDRRISGQIRSGKYGRACAIVDSDSMEKTHDKTVTEAEMLPLYFLVDVPRGTDEAFLILERSGVQGILVGLEQALADFLRVELAAHALVVGDLVPKDLARQLMNKGQATELRLIRFGLPSDLASVIRQTHKEKTTTAELRVQLRGGGLDVRDRVLEYFDGKRSVKGFIELSETHFDYDNVKVAINVGGRTHTLDLGQINRLRPYYDVTGQVEMGPDGHPIFDSIEGIAIDLLKDIRAGVYGKASDDG